MSLTYSLTFPLVSYPSVIHVPPPPNSPLTFHPSPLPFQPVSNTLPSSTLSVYIAIIHFTCFPDFFPHWVPHPPPAKKLPRGCKCVRILKKPSPTPSLNPPPHTPTPPPPLLSVIKIWWGNIMLPIHSYFFSSTATPSMIYSVQYSVQYIAGINLK